MSKGPRSVAPIWIYVLLGTSLMLNYNVLLTYFKDLYTDEGTLNKIQSIYVWSSCISQIFLVSPLSSFLSYNIRKYIGILVTIIYPIVMISVSGFRYDPDAKVGMFAMLALGIFGAFAQNSSAGICGILGTEAIEGYMFGYGVAGILANTLTLILNSLTQNKFHSATIHFAIAALINSIAGYFFIVYAIKFTNVKHAIHTISSQAISNDEENIFDPSIELNRPMKNENSEDDDILTREDITYRSTLEIIKDAYPQIINVFTTLFVTFCVFPCIVFSWKYNINNFYTCITFTYNIFEVLGRYAPRIPLFLPKAQNVKFIVLSRFLLIAPAYYFVDESSFTLWLALALLAVFAFTSGLCVTASFIYCPQQVSYAKEKDVVNKWMSCALMLGIALGNELTTHVSPLVFKFFNLVKPTK